MRIMGSHRFNVFCIRNGAGVDRAGSWPGLTSLLDAISLTYRPTVNSKVGVNEGIGKSSGSSSFSSL